MTFLDKCFLTSFIAIGFVAMESAVLSFLSSEQERMNVISNATAGLIDFYLVIPFAIVCFGVIANLYVRGHQHVKATASALDARAALLRSLHNDGASSPSVAQQRQRERGRSPSPTKRRRSSPTKRVGRRQQTTEREADAAPPRRSPRLRNRGGGN